MEESRRDQDSETETNGHWFLKVDDDHIRGPVPFATLREWAESGALKADEQVSRDGHFWQPAANLKALEFEWCADIGSGQYYGPFNLMAAPQLVLQGILKADSVLRRYAAIAPRQTPAVVPTEIARPHAAPPARMPGSRAMMSDGTRMGQLERELKALHAELATLHRQRQETGDQQPEARGLTSTRQDDLTQRIDQIYDKAHRAESMLQQLVQGTADVEEVPSPLLVEPVPESGELLPQRAPEDRFVIQPVRRRPLPVLYVDETDAHEEYEMSRPERVRALARTRRFRVQTLRWNLINSSLAIGTGTTVGAIGLILDVHPVTWTGLILAAIGSVHFLFTMAIWFGSKLINWAHVSVVSDTEAMAGGRPVRGMLNVTFFWFKRRFGSKHTEPPAGH